MRGEDRLQALADGHRVRQRLRALQLLAAQAAVQLEQGERIPAGRGDERLGDLRRDPHVPIVIEQLDGGLRVEASELELRDPLARKPCPRAAKSMTTPSASSRRAANASAPADASSSQCASSTTQRSGPSSLAAASRLSVAAPM